MKFTFIYLLPLWSGASSAFSQRNSQIVTTKPSFSVGQDNKPKEATTPKPLAAEFVWTQQWYPVLPVSHLPQDNSVKKMTILDRPLVIWKSGDEKWSVMADLCPHRRAPLSTGKVVQDPTGDSTLMCRFHGWEFDAQGKCQRIPMQTAADKTDCTKFSATTYASQVRGGLLWVFMDPTHSSPPQIPKDALETNEDMNWIVTSSPVSYMSMVENSFDPAHAPFLHEGTSTYGDQTFSPQISAPMEVYQTIVPSTKEGFTVEHSPYLRTGGNATTTRQFLPPCTQITKSPFFTTKLFFVPSTVGETIVIGGMPRSNKRPLLPKRFHDFYNDLGHYLFANSESYRRFVAQDTITMQGQDRNKHYTKSLEHVVMDAVPFPADHGVSVFQKWVKTFAKRGPIVGEAQSLSQAWSQWDAHTKHCPTCQKMIRRFSKWSSLSQTSSKVCVSLSVALQLILTKTRVSLAFLTTAVLLQRLSRAFRNKVEETFVSNNAHSPFRQFLFRVYSK